MMAVNTQCGSAAHNVLLDATYPDAQPVSLAWFHERVFSATYGHGLASFMKCFRRTIHSTSFDIRLHINQRLLTQAKQGKQLHVIDFRAKHEHVNATAL